MSLWRRVRYSQFWLEVVSLQYVKQRMLYLDGVSVVCFAGKPFPVRNCTLSNQTSSSVEVSCQPGFDGGLPQYFLLELYSSDSGVPRYNLTSSDHPTFFLSNLEPDVTFRIAVFAVNSKGRSPGIVLEEVTFRDAEKRTGKWISIIRYLGMKTTSISLLL
jgi:hypothetical protein